MLQQNATVTTPASNLPTGFLPGMQDYIPVKIPRTTRVKTISADDEKNLAILLNLQPNQAKALSEFVEVVLKQTAETLIAELGNVTSIRNITITDFIIPEGGRCDVAKANGCRDHVLRYLYRLEVKTDDDKTTIMELGSDCFMKAAGLNSGDAKLCRSIHGWVVNGASRSLIRLLSKSIGSNISVKQMSDTFKRTDVYSEMMSNVQTLAMNLNRAFPKGASSRNQQMSIGRVKVALASITLLVSNDLPVPDLLINRVRRAAKWVN